MLSVLCRHTDQAAAFQILPDVNLLLLLASDKFLVTSMPQFLLCKMGMLAIALPLTGFTDRQAGGSSFLSGEGTSKDQRPSLLRRPTLPASVLSAWAEAPSPAGAFWLANSQGGSGVSAKDR